MINLKSLLKIYTKHKLIVLSILALIIFLFAVYGGIEVVGKLWAYKYLSLNNDKNSITVSGEGKVYAKPDIALVNISVVSDGKKVIDVENDNTKKNNQIIKFLKDSGVEDKDIKTINYSLYPRYNYYEQKTPEIIGYEITQTLEVKIRSLDKTGEILDGAIKNGANQIGSLYFKVDNDEALQDQARKLAIDDAKQKAEKLASQLRIRLVRLSAYNESGTPYLDYRGLEYGVGGGGGTAPQIQTGESEIVITVNLTYEMH